MTRLFIRHSVSDYDQWRKHYEAFGENRDAMGVTGAGVFRASNDPGDVTVCHDFATLEKAQAFAGSPKLKAAMAGAGVVSAPQFWFAEPV